jgi:hypothetical protein
MRLRDSRIHGRNTNLSKGPSHQFVPEFHCTRTTRCVSPCGSCKSRRFEGTCRLHLQGRKISKRRKCSRFANGLSKVYVNIQHEVFCVVTPCKLAYGDTAKLSCLQTPDVPFCIPSWGCSGRAGCLPLLEHSRRVCGCSLRVCVVPLYG